MQQNLMLFVVQFIYLPFLSYNIISKIKRKVAKRPNYLDFFNMPPFWKSWLLHWRNLLPTNEMFRYTIVRHVTWRVNGLNPFPKII